MALDLPKLCISANAEGFDVHDRLIPNCNHSPSESYPSTEPSAWGTGTLDVVKSNVEVGSWVVAAVESSRVKLLVSTTSSLDLQLEYLEPRLDLWSTAYRYWKCSDVRALLESAALAPLWSWGLRVEHSWWHARAIDVFSCSLTSSSCKSRAAVI
jgi:hypothetical protein